MNYTSEQLIAFRAEFAVRRRRRIVTFVGGLSIAVVSALLMNGPTHPRVFAFLTLAAFVGVVVSTVWNWRCPACSAYLGRTFTLNFCPSCGVPLA
jgi:hypothetical protein